MPSRETPPDQAPSAAEAATNIWKNLQTLRNAFRLSDSEIARLTGIGRRTVGNKLEGRTPLTTKEAILLSELFGAPLEVLRQSRQECAVWVADHWDDMERHVRSRCSWLRQSDGEWPNVPISA